MKLSDRIRRVRRLYVMVFLGGLLSGLLIVGCGGGDKDAKPKEGSLTNVTEAMIHITYGKEYDEEKKFDEAYKEYQKALELDPNNADALHLVGNYHYRNRNYDEAIAAYEKVIRLDDKRSSTLMNLGACFFRVGKPNKAEEYWQRSIDVNPNNWAAKENLAQLYAATGKPENIEKAFSLYKSAMDNEEARRVPKLHYGFVDLCIRVGAYEEAIDNIQGYVLLRNPNDPFGLTLLGKAQVLSGKVKEGIETLKKAINAHPGLPGAYIFLANTYKVNDYPSDEVVNLLNRLNSNTESQKHIAYTIIATTHCEREEWEKAKAAVAKAKEFIEEARDKNLLSDLHYVQGRLAEKEGDKDMAKSHYKQAIDLCPQCDYAKPSEERLKSL